MPTPSLRSHVRSLRGAAGLSQVELAQRVGISRQSLAAIEAERQVPSAATALRLAQELGCRVEALFELEDGPSVAVVAVGLPADAGPTRAVLAQVDGRWVAHALGPHDLHPADALVTHTPHPVATLLTSPAEVEHRALVAGCAPLLGLLANRIGSQERAARVAWLDIPSERALDLLADSLVHVAGLHLRDDATGTFNEVAIRARLRSQRLVLVHMVGWRQGLLVRADESRPIRGPDDLVIDGLRVARRQNGSGAARVLAQELARHSIPEAQVGGGPDVRSHHEAALAVRFGAADVAIGVEAVAIAHGLRFVPLVEERFDLVFRDGDESHPGVARLLEELTDTGFWREALRLGPYETHDTGVRRVLEVA